MFVLLQLQLFATKFLQQHWSCIFFTLVWVSCCSFVCLVVAHSSHLLLEEVPGIIGGGSSTGHVLKGLQVSNHLKVCVYNLGSINTFSVSCTIVTLSPEPPVWFLQRHNTLYTCMHSVWVTMTLKWHTTLMYLLVTLQVGFHKYEPLGFDTYCIYLIEQTLTEISTRFIVQYNHFEF